MRQKTTTYLKIDHTSCANARPSLSREEKGTKLERSLCFFCPVVPLTPLAGAVCKSVAEGAICVAVVVVKKRGRAGAGRVVRRRVGRRRRVSQEPRESI